MDYEILAWIIDLIIHPIAIVFIFGGLFVPGQRFPKFKFFHSCFNLSVFTMQLFFGLRCPLVVLSMHLREIANGGALGGSDWYYKPFTVELLHNLFGFEAPAIAITVIMMIIVALSIVSIISLSRKKS